MNYWQLQSIFALHCCCWYFIFSQRNEARIIPVVSAYENVVNYACREWVDEVFIHTTGKNVHIEKLGNYTVSISSINVATPVQLFAKRALDIIEGIVGCICTLVIYIVIAPKIKKNLLIRELPVCGK